MSAQRRVQVLATHLSSGDMESRCDTLASLQDCFARVSPVTPLSDFNPDVALYDLNRRLSPFHIKVLGSISSPAFLDILSEEALIFLAELQRRFNSVRLNLLRVRKEKKRTGYKLHFLEETKHIREGNWKVAPIPEDLKDRRVEITGPVSRKMVINALNSGAACFMADFEDSSSPTWENMVDGQINMRDAVNKTITFTSPEKIYRLNPKTAVLLVRPRGWHMDERHVLVDGKPMSASLFDFGLYIFHNAKTLLRNGTGPYFYLPKMESHMEARLWNDVFVTAQMRLGIPVSTIRATVLIETISAAFEMDEILYELRDHSSGLNCGRWDYIFSFIKLYAEDPRAVMPDRGMVTMDKHFLASYVKLLIQTCHKRGVHAMGGMAAQIPIRDDPKANQMALDKVHSDKLREVLAGHDGTWVAHPALIPVAKKVFDEHMPTPNQINTPAKDIFFVSEEDLLRVPCGPITRKGLEANISVAIKYIEAWLRGNGCVPINNLMEDAATAEISRCQIWHWIRHGCKLDEGVMITPDLVNSIIMHELDKTQRAMGERFNSSKFVLAATIFQDLATSAKLEDFLTLVAYDYI